MPAMAMRPPARAPRAGTWVGAAKPVLLFDAALEAADAPDERAEETLLAALETLELATELALLRSDDSLDRADWAREPVVSEAKDCVMLATTLVNEASMLLRSWVASEATEEATEEAKLWASEATEVAMLLASDSRDEARDAS